MPRSLEVALKSSMNTSSLNNLISSLRVHVKSSKVCAIHKLTHQIERIRKKRGVEAQVQDNAKKISRLTDVVRIIKKLNPDKAAKFALGNTLSMQDVSAKFKNDMEMKALVLLSLQKPLLTRVNKWREEHPDWKALASFIMQHTGKRYNPKDIGANRDIESKPKFKHQLRSTDSPAMLDNQGNEDSLSKTDSENNISTSKVISHKDFPTTLKSKIMKRKQEENNVSETKHASSSKKACIDSKLEYDTSEQTLDSEMDSDNENDSSNSSENDAMSSMLPDKASENENSESDVENSEILQQRISEESGDSNESHENHQIQAITNPRDQRGDSEMVVRKLDLLNKDTLLEGSDRDMGFLFKDSSKMADATKSEKKPKRQKDPFFASREQDEYSDSEDKVESEQCDSESDQDEDITDVAKRAMYQSTFMGSLAGPAPKFKDFAAFRKDKRGKKKAILKKDSTGGMKHKQFKRKVDETKNAKTSGNKLAAANSSQEKLHPSWEASKLRKQQATLQVFQGKKKTFAE